MRLMETHVGLPSLIMLKFQYLCILLSIYAHHLSHRDQEQQHDSQTVAQEHYFPLHSFNLHQHITG